MEILTGISQIQWCSYDLNNKAECPTREKNECKNPQCQGVALLNKFEPALINGKPYSWFDKLFIKGINISKGNPTTMIITGPPGSGKSTLALELCYKIASQEDPLLPLYLSFESSTKSLVEKAEKFGWNKFTNTIIPYEGDKDDFINKLKEKELTNQGAIAFWDKDTCRKKFKGNEDTIFLTFELIANVIKTVSDDFININDTLPLLKKFIAKYKQTVINNFHPKILVIDSLNIVSDNAQRSSLFETISEKLTNTDLIIYIIDSIEKQHSDWEFKSDIILSLNYSSNDDYFLRTIEIIKARNQEHILGKHQLKIHPKFEADTSEIQSCCDRNIIHHRAHPYREDGGIVIYPSMHYYLSGYRKRSAPTSTEALTDSPLQLSEIMSLPIGRCTGLVGERGTHKSHMAYMYLLHNIIVNKYKGLIITLREDEKKTIETLQIILNQIIIQGKFKGSQPSKFMYDYIQNNSLEILYFLPGYITPNEFFHRIFLSTHRMKQNGSKVISVFNSLDQIEARFPLCTKEDIFIPSIIEFFLGEHVTNVFIAVNEGGKTLDKYGLLPMADYVLSFGKKTNVSPIDFQNQLSQNKNIQKFRNHDAIGTNKIDTVEVKVEKHSGGRPKVKTGFLELDTAKKYFINEGIYFS